MDRQQKIDTLKEKSLIASQTATKKTTLNEQKVSESSQYNIDDDNRELIKNIQDFRDSTSSNLIILWGVGTGKTFLSKKIYPDYFFCPETLFKQLNVSKQLVMRSPKEFEYSVKLFPLEALQKLPWVIYDDYWCCEPTEAYIEKMLFWLERVENPRRKTIITSNLSLADMKKRDERIFSRMMQNSTVIIASWPDRRLSDVKIINL